jgi:hypothetical protein
LVLEESAEQFAGAHLQQCGGEGGAAVLARGSGLEYKNGAGRCRGH